MYGPITLKTEIFRVLGRRWTGIHTPLSPLESGAMPILPAHQEQLQRSGFVDAGGRLTPEIYHLFSVLGQASTVVDLTYLDKQGEIQHVIHVSPESAEPVVVTTTGDSTTVQLLSSPDMLLNELAGRLPGSQGSSMPFSVDLPPKDALILAALMDQQRQSAQATMASKPTAQAPPVIFYPYELEQILHNYVRSAWNWPLLALISTITAPEAPSGDEIGQVFSRLISSGCLVRSGQGYIFHAHLLSFVNRLLVPEFSLLCTTRTLRSPGRISKDEFDIIGFDGGILSIVSHQDDTNVVAIRAMAPDAILDIVRRAATAYKSFPGSHEISCPSGSASPQSFQQGPKQSGSFCTSCGTPAGSGAKFCRSCGAPLEQTSIPATCPGCGQLVRTGAKFCRYCGQKVG